MSFIPVPIQDATLEVNLKVNSHSVKLVKQQQTFVNKWYRTFFLVTLSDLPLSLNPRGISELQL